MRVCIILSTPRVVRLTLNILLLLKSSVICKLIGKGKSTALIKTLRRRKQRLIVLLILFVVRLLIIILVLLLLKLFLQDTSEVLVDISEWDNFIVVITMRCCLHIHMGNRLVALIVLLLVLLVLEIDPSLACLNLLLRRQGNLI